MKRFFALMLVFLLCAPIVQGEARAEGLRIVTTIFPEYDFARAVAGDLAEIEMLIKPGAESHSYEPTPMDIIAIQKCDVFICVGGENDTWAQKILSGLDTSGMQIVRLMEIVEPCVSEHHHADEEGHEDHEEHAHEYDEHVWTSPMNAMAIVSAIAEALSQADPANADAYAANAAAYNAQIAQVDEEIRAIVSGAVRKELVFGDRFPFLYFANEYGLDWESAFPGCSTDAEVSAATVAALIEKVKQMQMPVVFYIELSTHRIADTICEATGAQGMLLHSCQNVTREEFEAGETYVSLMQKNCVTLREALCK
ncbi:MAG: zinc ABC transporter substrate-binding protein [Clostridia bacterium]|nr:zinc ABC transporter substrate-binding protein [Clostridia bacterium]